MSQLFKNLCPLYISIGMTYDEFWNYEPERAKYYYEAYKLKAKLKREEDDINLWKSGMYDYEALIRVSPILHAFSKKRNKTFTVS